MNVSLTPELNSFVRRQVDGGAFGSSSEVVREALRLLHARQTEHEAKLAWLRSEVQRGLDSGPATPMDFAATWREARDEFLERETDS